MTDILMPAADPTVTGEETPAAPRVRGKRGWRGKHNINFSNTAQREQHVEVFRAWLPAPLADAPGLDWDALPSEVMKYLLNSVGESPDDVALCLAAGCYARAKGKPRSKTLYNMLAKLNVLIMRLRDECGLRDLAEIRSPELWDRYVGNRLISAGEQDALDTLEVMANSHQRAWLESLDPVDRPAWAARVLPIPPANFGDRWGQRSRVTAETQARCKAQSDVLVPLFPVLVEVAKWREQATERLLLAFRRERERVLRGEVALPHRFEHTEILRTLSEDARTLSEVTFVERPVTLRLTLWNRLSWFEAHRERYASGRNGTERNARERRRSYAPENDLFFLEYTGAPEDLLWFGDVIQARGFSQLNGRKALYVARRPGLLTPTHLHAKWFEQALRDGEMIMEPESLYRGVLFGAAAAAIAMTNASRVSELLQVSLDRFRKVVTPQYRDGKPTGAMTEVWVQDLLPKGYYHDADRQMFLMAPAAVPLLRKVAEMLRAAHDGAVPVVDPHRSTKEEDLVPERYLFQWGASEGGRLGVFEAHDIGTALRFLFHGLELRTRTPDGRDEGERIVIAVHLLRHVTATHFRRVLRVPAEAVQFMLHHRALRAAPLAAVPVSAATEYYTRAPQEELLGQLSDLQMTLATTPVRVIAVPDPDELDRLSDDLRETIEEWGTIGETLLGHCKAGLCVRPRNRALCMCCEYQVPYHKNLHKIAPHRRILRREIARLEDIGADFRDLREVRRRLQYLDDMEAIMLLQRDVLRDSGEVPAIERLLEAGPGPGDGR